MPLVTVLHLDIKPLTETARDHSANFLSISVTGLHKALSGIIILALMHAVFRGNEPNSYLQEGQGADGSWEPQVGQWTENCLNHEASKCCDQHDKMQLEANC